MANSFITTIQFLLLLFSQVFLFNHLNLFGFINPMIYVLFMYWYPIRENRLVFLGISFLLGFFVDIFSDTLAVHTASAITVAYFRPMIMRFVFGVNYEFQNFKLGNSTRLQQITFLALLILTHHLIYFSLEIFSFGNLLLILKRTLFVFCGSLVVSLLLGSLFSLEKE